MMISTEAEASGNTGPRLLRARGEIDPQENCALRVFRRIVPTTNDYRGDHFIVRNKGKLCATPLLAVLILLSRMLCLP